MATIIYQPVAGRLRINGRDFSLEDLVMDYTLSTSGTYLIRIRSKVTDTGVSDVPLADIKDNLGVGYANIGLWLAWWESLTFMGTATATIPGVSTAVKQDTIISELQDIEAGTESLKNKQFPNVGIHVLTGTDAAPAGTYTGFLVLEEAAISAITLTVSAKVTGTNNFSGVTLSVGTFIEIPGGFSTITLASGSMILIKGA